MLLCFCCKKTVIWYKNTTATTDSLHTTTHLSNLARSQSSKWQQAISFLCKEWVHWRSIPSRQLWQSTDRSPMGRCRIYRHPNEVYLLPLYTESCPVTALFGLRCVRCIQCGVSSHRLTLLCSNLQVLHLWSYNKYMTHRCAPSVTNIIHSRCTVYNLHICIPLNDCQT